MTRNHSLPCPPRHLHEGMLGDTRLGDTRPDDPPTRLAEDIFVLIRGAQSSGITLGCSRAGS